MIVSENGNYLDMELPKQGTSLAPFVTKVKAADLLPPQQKKIHFEGKL